MGRRVASTLAAWLTLLHTTAAATGTATGGALWTRVEPQTAGEFRLAFGSCSKADRAQPMWDVVRARQPDIFAWMGDAVYADTSVLGPWRIPAGLPEIEANYALQNTVPAYLALKASTPVIGVWDDHDYGINDGDRRYKWREGSKQHFLDFLGEPLDSPRRLNQSGVWGVHRYEVERQRIRVILLDVRFDRDPWGEAGLDMLGAEQWQWLADELARHTADVTLIGNGLQVLSDEKLTTEYWGKFPESLGRLVSLLAVTGTRHALLLSGDVHYAEVTRLSCPALGYPLLELTSSGMTHSWAGFKANVIRLSVPGYRRVGPNWLGLNSGEVAIKLPLPGPRTHASAELRVFAPDGRTVIRHTVPLSALEPGAEHQVSADAVACAATPLTSKAEAAVCRRIVSGCSPHLGPAERFFVWRGLATVASIILGFLACTARLGWLACRGGSSARLASVGLIFAAVLVRYAKF